MISTLRASHVFICVEVFVDGKRVGGNGGTFMRVEVDSICKEVLALFLQMYAPDYYPLPDDVKVTLLCTKISDTIQGRPTSDVGTLQDCSVFLDFPVSMPMSEVPTKRFLFKCLLSVCINPPCACGCFYCYNGVTFYCIISSTSCPCPICYDCT
jgi:hypothetical protein